MADQQRSRGRSQNGSARDGGDGSRRQSGDSRRISAREAVERVREEIPALIGRPVESVLGVQPDDDGGWHAIVQVVELSRVPNSTDVLGAYLVTLDGDGEIQGYQRQRRYVRSQADED
jgi:hypothetical protein